jgi:hypothetical protein
VRTVLCAAASALPLPFLALPLGCRVMGRPRLRIPVARLPAHTSQTSVRQQERIAGNKRPL